MKLLVISMIAVLLVSCSEAPKDADGNLSSYRVLGRFKGNTIYKIDRGLWMYLYVSVRDVDSSVNSMSTMQGKTNTDIIIINNDTLSKMEALDLLSK